MNYIYIVVLYLIMIKSLVKTYSSSKTVAVLGAQWGD